MVETYYEIGKGPLVSRKFRFSHVTGF